MKPLKTFTMDAKIETTPEGIFVASYKCPDKECGADHVIGTLDADIAKSKAIFDAWQKVMTEAVMQIGRDVLKANGLYAEKEQIVNVRDMN